MKKGIKFYIYSKKYQLKVFIMSYDVKIEHNEMVEPNI